MTRGFLPGIGFRDSGVRLRVPVAQKAANGRTVTVTELVSTIDGSDLVYEVEWHGEQDIHVERDRVVLHGASTDPGCRPGGMSVAVRAGKLVCSRTLPPVADAVSHVEIEIAGDGGEWRIPLDLEPIGAEQQHPSRTLSASDTRGDITVAVDLIARTADAVGLEIRAHTTRAQVQVAIGGLHGLRDETTAMRLHDAAGQIFVEQVRQDARDQLPGHLSGADVAIFTGVPADASDLTLEVPYVSTSEHEATGTEIHLPVSEPISIELAKTQVRLVASRPAELPGGRGPAIALDFERGGWHDDRRVIAPLDATLDGRSCGLNWSGGLYAPAPQPVAGILLACETPTEAHTVSLRGAFVQQRGPWRLHLGPLP